MSPLEGSESSISSWVTELLTLQKKVLTAFQPFPSLLASLCYSHVQTSFTFGLLQGDKEETEDSKEGEEEGEAEGEGDGEGEEETEEADEGKKKEEEEEGGKDAASKGKKKA